MSGNNKLLRNPKVKICADQQRVSQIILNLISNSLKFTNNGGYVKVKGKVLNQKSDLSFPEE